MRGGFCEERAPKEGRAPGEARVPRDPAARGLQPGVQAAQRFPCARFSARVKVSGLLEDSALGCPAAHMGSELHEGLWRAESRAAAMPRQQERGGEGRVTGDPEHEGATLCEVGGWGESLC